VQNAQSAVERVRYTVFQMVWFYERSGGALRVETRFDSATNEYVLDVAWPGRPVLTERFSDVDAFEVRVLALERQLDAERWKQVGGPQILPHGWRGVITH
jgi:hypothetical protein